MSDFRDTYVIARRELLERVKSKWFLVMTLLGPIGMVAMVLVPALLAGRGVEGAKIDIVDQSHLIGEALAAELTAIGMKPNLVDDQTKEQTELDRIRSKQINGFIRIPAEALQEPTQNPAELIALLSAMASGQSIHVAGTIQYRGDNASSQAVNILLRQATNHAVQSARGKQLGVAQDKLDRILVPAAFDAEQNNGVTGSSGMASFLIAYILAFILYMVITLYGVGVMRSVVQEKTSRVMELMVATVKPRSLMAGKILGVGAAGLIQITIWLAMGAITLAYRDEILGAFGAHGSGPALPPLAFTEVAIVIIYFILGFFFYASMYAAVGAMVSSEQDTQQVQMPVTMVLVIGVLCLQMVSNDPRGHAAATMTMLPFWSSMLMPMRYILGGATLGDVAISLAILIVSTILVARAAAKIYRVGVLMYGKRPGVRELIRWLRY